jgi:2-octaprenyl-6-methoxyphenol hydroxylase
MEQPGLVRIGNAAQTLHPVAGQGFNLGLRDAWWLAETILDSSREQLGDAAFLKNYHKHRRWDVGGGIAMTDILVDVFANDLPVLSQMRGLALSVMDAMPPLKNLFARKMMFGAQA